MHHTETERNHDGHLTFYLLFPGFRIIKILVLISCPMYLFVPPPPTLPLHQNQVDLWPFGTVEQSEVRGISRGFSLN